MRGTLIIVLLAGAVAVGCSKKTVEPEKPLVVVVSEREVPESVMKSFANTYPRASIYRVHKEVFKDGTVNYAFHFRSFQGSEREVYLNSAGRPVEH